MSATADNPQFDHLIGNMDSEDLPRKRPITAQTEAPTARPEPVRWSNDVPPNYREAVTFAALTYLICWTCGALVLHRDVHDRWHDEAAHRAAEMCSSSTAHKCEEPTDASA